MEVVYSSVVFVRKITNNEKINLNSAFPSLLRDSELQKKVLKDIRKENKSDAELKDWYLEEDGEPNPVFLRSKYENGVSFSAEINRAEVIYNGYNKGITIVSGKLSKYFLLNDAKINGVGINMHVAISQKKIADFSQKLFNMNVLPFTRAEFFPVGVILGFELSNNAKLRLVLDDEGESLLAKANFHRDLDQDKDVKNCVEFINRYDEFKEYLEGVLEEVRQ